MILRELQAIYACEGIRGFARIAAEKVTGRSIRSYRCCERYLKGAIGLEIGGPSALFAPRRLFPVYGIAERVDNLTFRANTLWQQSGAAGPTYRYNKHHAPGNQYFGEAANLEAFNSETFAFLLSSHVIEHIANPLGALLEWARVLKIGGIMVLVVPHKAGTFDHHRPVTTFNHLMSDFSERMPETDTTHVPEVLKFHDLARDPYAGTASLFKQRTEDNFTNRGMHHHAFDSALVARLVDFAKLRIVAMEAVRPYHIFAIAKKLPADEVPDNLEFLGPAAPHRLASPFPVDRL